jgi:hypothetical protein
MKHISIAFVLVVLTALLFMRHALVLRAGVAVANHRAADRVAAEGHRISFDVPDGWTPIIRTDMDDAWKPLGRRGLNTFIFADTESPFASGALREDPSSLRYQSWFGVYSVEFTSDQDIAGDEPSLISFADGLMQNDQLRWLKTMGDPSPTAQVAKREPKGTVKVLGRDLTIYEGCMQTHSDLGNGDTKMPEILGRPREVRVLPYHPLVLEGFVVAWRDATRKRLFVVYGNGVRFTNASGREVRTWPLVRDELLRIASTIRIE